MGSGIRGVGVTFQASKSWCTGAHEVPRKAQYCVIDSPLGHSEPSSRHSCHWCMCVYRGTLRKQEGMYRHTDTCIMKRLVDRYINRQIDNRYRRTDGVLGPSFSLNQSNSLSLRPGLPDMRNADDDRIILRSARMNGH